MRETKQNKPNRKLLLSMSSSSASTPVSAPPPQFSSYTTCWDVIQSYPNVSLKDKTVFLTGPTSGIGVATALTLGSIGATLILCCRNESEGEKVRKEIGEKYGNRNVHLVNCDLSSLSSIRTVPSQLEALKVTAIDITIFNAGMLTGRAWSTTVDGFDVHFGM
jgi:NAD(P)-dependent dehydrogenase (short-subunit alcohol dehydrogenase family)